MTYGFAGNSLRSMHNAVIVSDFFLVRAEHLRLKMVAFTGYIRRLPRFPWALILLSFSLTETFSISLIESKMEESQERILEGNSSPLLPNNCLGC